MVKEDLQRIKDQVLPPESMPYVRLLNERRFSRHADTDQIFFSPSNLLGLLVAAYRHRGSLNGDDRQLMIAEGVTPAAFELPDHYSYLQVPAEGRMGLLPIEELPYWLPVTLRQEPEPHTRIGFRRATPRDAVQHLTFTIDADFQRAANHATIILAPNWFAEPSTKMAVLDAFMGPPVPSKLQGIAVDDPLVIEEGWKDGSDTTVKHLRKVLPGRPLWLSCRHRNLPGT